MIEGFKKKEAVEQTASGVDVEYSEKDQALLYILERMAEYDEMNEQERQRQNQDVATADGRRETKKRAISINDEDGVGGRTPEGKRKKVGNWWKY